MKLIDVTVPLDRDLPLHPGNTLFVLGPIKRIARVDRSNVSALHKGAHTGTHVDAPRHFFDGGAVAEGQAPGVDDADGAPARVVLRAN